jgi:hypothetical protein
VPEIKIIMNSVFFIIRSFCRLTLQCSVVGLYFGVGLELYCHGDGDVQIPNIVYNICKFKDAGEREKIIGWIKDGLEKCKGIIELWKAIECRVKFLESQDVDIKIRFARNTWQVRPLKPEWTCSCFRGCGWKVPYEISYEDVESHTRYMLNIDTCELICKPIPICIAFHHELLHVLLYLEYLCFDDADARDLMERVGVLLSGIPSGAKGGEKSNIFDRLMEHSTSDSNSKGKEFRDCFVNFLKREGRAVDVVNSINSIVNDAVKIDTARHVAGVAGITDSIIKLGNIKFVKDIAKLGISEKEKVKNVVGQILDLWGGGARNQFEELNVMLGRRYRWRRDSYFLGESRFMQEYYSTENIISWLHMYQDDSGKTGKLTRAEPFAQAFKYFYLAGKNEEEGSSPSSSSLPHSSPLSFDDDTPPPLEGPPLEDRMELDDGNGGDDHPPPHSSPLFLDSEEGGDTGPLLPPVRRRGHPSDIEPKGLSVD